MSIHLAANAVAPVAADVAYHTSFSRDVEHPAWDAFVARTPDGHPAQTTPWAQAKASLGWDAARVVLTSHGRVVAGAQMLIRSVPLAGAVAYVCRGPVCAEGRPDLALLVVRELHTLARGCRVRYLAVQPPRNGQTLAHQLPDLGFWRSSFSISQPTATAMVDLSSSPDALLAAMHTNTRRNIQLGLRKGIVVRQGTDRDLPTFYRLLAATGQRQRFVPDNETYISEMYRLLAPRGWLALFMAEYEGEPVSAAIAVCFGDTVFYKRGAWSGRHKERRPNEVMHWEMIRWAQAQGYRYYDFDGITPECANALLRGEPIPAKLNRTVNSFKLGFGGQVVLLPHVYSYVYNPVLRTACRVVPGVSDLRLVRWAIRDFRATRPMPLKTPGE